MALEEEMESGRTHLDRLRVRRQEQQQLQQQQPHQGAEVRDETGAGIEDESPEGETATAENKVWPKRNQSSSRVYGRAGSAERRKHIRLRLDL